MYENQPSYDNYTASTKTLCIISQISIGLNEH